MGIPTKQGMRLQQATNPQKTYDQMTLGIVVDTNDPQQMGRIRAVCTKLGDTFDTPINELPWALYASPFAGHLANTTRGPGVQETEGFVSYGMWFIPKVGSQVLIQCLDGNINQRVYTATVYSQQTPHTMPHGRFMYDDSPFLEKTGSDAAPYGPYSTSEKFIEPLATNIQKAFGSKAAPNFEWQTRAADYTATAVDPSMLNQIYSRVPDDKDYTDPTTGWVSRQGYETNRIDPNETSPDTGRVYDSSVHSITTPGFHAFSMDDRMENCRVRFRTSAGHQIIMDDTNERIYIQTAQGNNWIEIDQAGNIDMFTTKRVSIHAQKEINLTSDDTIRMQAANGIHMKSGKDIRMQSAADVNIIAGGNLQASATQANIQTSGDFNLNSGGVLNLTGSGTVSLYSNTSDVDITALAGGVNILGSGDVLLTGANIGINGPPASPGTAAGTASPQPAFWTDRVPQHEPWARTMTKNDFTHDPEYSYDSPNVNKIERGVGISRGQFWRR